MSGFGGYTIITSVTEISAHWTVPAIARSSPAGWAGTWIGTDNAGQDFIQLGILENRLGSSASTDQYEAFWSDTQLRFHASNLGLRIGPRDELSAQMTQTHRGWTLDFRDLTRHSTKSFKTSYGAGVTFTRAEWLQEDPARNGSSFADLPYPTTGTVTFTALMVDRRPPALTYADAQALSALNGVFLVPSHVVADGFSIRPATALALQYLRDVQALNVALGRFGGDALRGGDRSAAAADGKLLISAIAAAGMRLKAQTWPKKVRYDVARLVAHNAKLAADLRVWEAAGASTQPQALARFSIDIESDHSFADSIRADLGLPPSQ